MVAPAAVLRGVGIVHRHLRSGPSDLHTHAAAIQDVRVRHRRNIRVPEHILEGTDVTAASSRDPLIANPGRDYRPTTVNFTVFRSVEFVPTMISKSPASTTFFICRS